MKKITILLLTLVAAWKSFSQTPYAVWNDQSQNNYKYVQLSSATGVKTNLVTLPPMSGFISGDISAINPDSNYYYFAGQVNTNRVFFTLDMASGTLINSAIMTQTVVGIEYNCADSTLYGIQVIGNAYTFVKFDPHTATATYISNITNMTGYVGGTFSLDLATQQYTFRVLTNGGYRLKSINVKTGVTVYDNLFPDNVVGHKFSATDQAVYGLWDDNSGTYKLEKINYVNGTHSTVGVLAGVVPGFVSLSQSMNQNGEYTFRGFNLNNQYTIFTFDATTATLLDSAHTTDNAVGFEEPVCFLPTTAVGGVSAPASFSLYPNPSNGTFSVSTLRDKSKLEITDLFGNVILNREINRGATQITNENLVAGAYVISVSDGQSASHMHLMISR